VTTQVVHVTVPAGEVDAAVDTLWVAGAAGIEERDARGGAVVLVAGTPSGEGAAALLGAVAPRWPAELVPVDLGTALDAWRSHARPVRVPPLVIRPPWVDAAAGDAVDVVDAAAGDAVDVVVDPGRAFGSGAHVSTRLALAALVARAPLAGRVLDVGCGSGVLAIAALLLGADEAVGLDHDPAAVEATRANAARNGLTDRVTVVGGDAAAGDVPVVDGEFDVVVANMLLSELVTVAPAVAPAVAPGGAVVLSGLLAAHQHRAEAAYGALGLVPDRVGGAPAEGGWVVVVLRPR
jgi:ribosomal protein L11 methyltransferase